jgi:hypothetical protein
MDKLVPGYLKSYATITAEDKEHDFYGNYHKIHQYSEQLALYAKQATHNPHVGLEEMDRLLQIGDVLKKELDHVRIEFSRRKNLELMLPSPNTQHHLPCSSMLSPTSSTPPSPTPQQSMAMSTNASSSSGSLVPQSPTGSTSPHGMMDGASMSIPSTGIMQSDEYWKIRKMDPTKIVRRSPTPLYVNLTEQMILAQSSKRKRPTEGDLYCHNCKTKDTPEWRRGPMGAKTLCNACGIRWRLSQSEASKNKKGDAQLSPTSTPQLQFPMSSMGLPSPHSPQSSPTQSPTTVPTQLQVSQSLLQQQQHLQQQHHQQQQHQQQQQQQQHHQQQQQQQQQQQHQQQQQQQQQQQHQQQQQQQQQMQRQHMQQMQHQHMQQLQQQYAQSHNHHNAPHPQQQHMIIPGPIGLAQENIPSRLALSADATNAPRSTGASGVLSALSLATSPIAT